MYEKGLGVKIDLKEAASQYRLAHYARNADAEYHLANMYHEGQGVCYDDTIAIFYFWEAARHGHPLALEKYTAIQE